MWVPTAYGPLGLPKPRGLAGRGSRGVQLLLAPNLERNCARRVLRPPTGWAISEGVEPSVEMQPSFVES